MDILHVHFEVVIPCKLLVAELALCHGAVGVVSQLVSDQHLLQAEGQVTNLRQWRQNKHKVLQFQACITLLRLHYWGHSHTYLQYLINELVFGRKTPSESTWKIFTLPGIFLCCILGVVAQAQGCCLSKRRLHLQTTNTLRCPGNIVVLCSDYFKATVLSGMQQKLWQNIMSIHQFKWSISFLTSRTTPAASNRISSNCSVTRKEEWEWRGSEDCKKG